MGKLRARTDAELAARRQEILDAAAGQLTSMDYDDITLATIAEKTSIGRTSMYNYYETKEAVFADLLIGEYEKLEQSFRAAFAEKMPREQFCETMARLLWGQPILLKLLSLQLSVWDHRYNDELVERFVKATQPYMQTLSEVLTVQFPDADDAARNRFKLQYSVYCNSLYAIEHLPASQMEAMSELSYFGTIPTGEEICRDGLMLLSAGLA